MLRFPIERRRKKPRGLALEVSVIGGGFLRLSVPDPRWVEEVPSGAFAYIRKAGEKHDLVVKIRGKSTRPPDGVLEGIRPAPDDHVIRIMRNMAKGVLWEENLRDIKIVDATLDKTVGLIRFTYCADQKHNLKRIAVQLSKVFHVRVEFQQIGARDYAQQLGGIGLCGREICCSLFLKEIPSVTLDMARRQYLFAMPEKLSGICGRLLCCLRYELPIYEELSRLLPPPGALVETEKGVGTVVEVSIPTESFKVQYPDNSEETIYLGADQPRWSVVKSSR